MSKPDINKDTSHNVIYEANETNEEAISENIQEKETPEKRPAEQRLIIQENTNVTKENKDTIIDIDIMEACLLTENMGRRSQSIWLYPTKLMTRQLWQHERRPHRQGVFPTADRWTQGGAGGGGYDYGTPLAYDPQSRNGFVGRVFAVVFIMLSITAIWLAVVLTNEEYREFFREHSLVMMIIGAVLLMIATYSVSCSSCAARPPCIFMMLIFVVVGMSILGAVVTTRFRTVIALYAFIATAGVVIICVLLACSSFDFTSFMLYIVVVAAAFSFVVMLIMIAMLVFKFYLKPLHIAILAIGVVIQSVVLVMELQMILGGKAVELSEDDYLLGAMMLYMSIVDIFLKLVQILGLLDE